MKSSKVFASLVCLFTTVLVNGCGKSTEADTNAAVNTSDQFRIGLTDAQDKVGRGLLDAKKRCNGTIWGNPDYVLVPGSQTCINIVTGYYFNAEAPDMIDPRQGGYMQCTPYRNLPCGGIEKALTTCANNGGGKACFEGLHPYIKRVICGYRLDTRGMCASVK